MSPKSRKRKRKARKVRKSRTPSLSPFNGLGSPADASAVGGKRHPVLLFQQIPGELGVKNPQIAKLMRDKYPAPQPHNCAEDIHFLLNHLSKEDNGNYLYRGQTRHYPALIPSIYRRAMAIGTEGEPVISIDPSRFHGALSERDKIRFKLLGEMMKVYGPSVGNIIAQQYGLSSEALDVTSDLKAAAFFATRLYPKYEHFPGTDDNPEGVIFRFPIPKGIPDLETLDILYTLAAKRVQPFGTVSFAAFRKRLDLGEEQNKAIESMFERYGGAIQAEVMTRPLVVDHTFYAREIRSSWSKRLMSQVPPLTDTRLLRQQGGSIRTISRWIASVSSQLDVVELPEFGFVFEPPFAIGEELIGVENISRYPGLEIFPFKHTVEAVIDLAPDYLWPDPETDWIYEHLMNLFAVSYLEYLEREGVAVNDLRRGLIDPGYEKSMGLREATVL